MKESELVFKAMQKRRISGCMDYKVIDNTEEYWKVLLLTENFKWVAVKIPKSAQNGG